MRYNWLVEWCSTHHFGSTHLQFYIVITSSIFHLCSSSFCHWLVSSVNKNNNNNTNTNANNNTNFRYHRLQWSTFYWYQVLRYNFESNCKTFSNCLFAIRYRCENALLRVTKIYIPNMTPTRCAYQLKIKSIFSNWWMTIKFRRDAIQFPFSFLFHLVGVCWLPSPQPIDWSFEFYKFIVYSRYTILYILYLLLGRVCVCCCSIRIIIEIQIYVHFIHFSFGRLHLLVRWQ